MKEMTQEQQVIDMMRSHGGYATLRQLNEMIDFSGWKTKTPEASVRRIVQNSRFIFRIQPGLWALEEFRDDVFRKFHVQQGDKQSEERFSHGYFQGLLVEIGKYSHHLTYVPAQDKSKVFLDHRLEDVTDMIQLPSFTHKDLLRRAKTIDVIWFNERMMPSSFYEVEHTTDIKNSLTKYYELQDFNAGFFIVANSSRRKEYEDKLHVSMFAPIEKRVKFIEYEKVVQMYEGLNKVSEASW